MREVPDLISKQHKEKGGREWGREEGNTKAGAMLCEKTLVTQALLGQRPDSTANSGPGNSTQARNNIDSPVFSLLPRFVKDTISRERQEEEFL